VAPVPRVEFGDGVSGATGSDQRCCPIASRPFVTDRLSEVEIATPAIAPLTSCVEPLGPLYIHFDYEADKARHMETRPSAEPAS
jgi:hypothetical protein